MQCTRVSSAQGPCRHPHIKVVTPLSFQKIYPLHTFSHICLYFHFTLRSTDCAVWKHSVWIITFYGMSCLRETVKTHPHVQIRGDPAEFTALSARPQPCRLSPPVPCPWLSLILCGAPLQVWSTDRHPAQQEIRNSGRNQMNYFTEGRRLVQPPFGLFLSTFCSPKQVMH